MAYYYSYLIISPTLGLVLKSSLLYVVYIYRSRGMCLGRLAFILFNFLTHVTVCNILTEMQPSLVNSCELLLHK